MSHAAQQEEEPHVHAAQQEEEPHVLHTLISARLLEDLYT
jgi:hypothetical protein